MARGSPKSRKIEARRPTVLASMRPLTYITLASSKMIDRSISAPSIRAFTPIDVYGPMYAFVTRAPAPITQGPTITLPVHLGGRVDVDASLHAVVTVASGLRLQRQLIEHQPVQLEQLGGVAAVATPGPDLAKVQAATGARKVLGHGSDIETRPRLERLSVGPRHHPTAEHADPREPESVASPIQLGEAQQSLQVGAQPIARVSVTVNQ